MTLQRWTIHTTDDRFGDGEHHPYVVEGVTSATKHDGVLHLWAGPAVVGSFPLANVTSVETDDGSELLGVLGVGIGDRDLAGHGPPAPEGADGAPQESHGGDGTTAPDMTAITRKGDG